MLIFNSFHIFVNLLKQVFIVFNVFPHQIDISEASFRLKKMFRSSIRYTFLLKNKLEIQHAFDWKFQQSIIIAPPPPLDVKPYI